MPLTLYFVIIFILFCCIVSVICGYIGIFEHFIMMFENELIENIGDLHKNSLLHILNAEGEEEDSVTYKSVVNHSP